MSAFRWSPFARTVPAASLLLLAACAAHPADSGARSDDAAVPNRVTAAAQGAGVAAGAGAGTIAGTGIGPGTPSAAPSIDPAGGLAPSADGYWLVSATPEPTAVRSVDYRFQVLAPDGSAVTSFLGGPGTARVYAVRSDLTGMRRTVPADLGEGVWSAALGELDPGLWRIYVAFTPNSNPGPAGRPRKLLLSRTLLVPGTPETSPLEPPSATASVDGLTVTLRGTPVVGRPTVLRLTMTRTTVDSHGPLRGTGVPVDTLEPLDGAYAEVTAARADDLALAAFTPLGRASAAATGGPGLAFRGVFTEAGDWRLFVHFRTDGQDHTASFTVPIRS
jgi:hypothetical protein